MPLFSEKYQVAEVGVWWVFFECIGNVVMDVLCGLHLLVPLLKATAVGEECDPSSFEALQAFGGESAAAGCGQPHRLWLTCRHHDGCFLAFNDCHGSLWMLLEQVLPEEALMQCPVGWQQSLSDEWHMGPSLVAFAVPVGPVLHDVAGVCVALLVYLPEDDVPLACGPDEVVVQELLHPFGRDAYAWCCLPAEPLPEHASPREALLHIGEGERAKGFCRNGGAGCRGCRGAGVHGCGGVGVVAVELCRSVVVSAGVLVVALAHLFGHILVVVVGVDIPDEAFAASAGRTGGFLLSASRDARGFQPVSEIVVHVCLVFVYYQSNYR